MRLGRAAVARWGTLTGCSLAVLLVALSGSGCAPSEPRHFSTADRGRIEEILTALPDAWNDRDAEAWVENFEVGSGFTNIIGMHFPNRDANEARHQELFETIFRASRLEARVLGVEPVGSEAAVAEVQFNLRGYDRLPPGIEATAPGVLETRLISVFRRADEDWVIVAAQNTALSPVLREARDEALPCGAIQLSTHRLYACQYGRQHRSTVLLDAGAREDSRAWDSVIDELGEFAHVITYDRAGLGRSEAGPGPRTVTVMAEEMHELADALDVRRPIVLVGHSAGGWRVRRFAELYPEEVAGVVLLDSPPEDFEAFRMSTLSPEEQAERLRSLEASRAGLSPGVRAEYEGMEDVGRELSGRFPDVPLVVVSAALHGWLPEDRAAEHEDGWRRLQEQVARSTPRGRFLIAEGSGHGIQRDDPDLVVRLVRELVEGGGQ